MKLTKKRKAEIEEAWEGKPDQLCTFIIDHAPELFNIWSNIWIDRKTTRDACGAFMPCSILQYYIYDYNCYDYIDRGDLTYLCRSLTLAMLLEDN